ncbi:MAG: ExbD/TolR family protein [Dysgonomonas sp.]
MAEINTGGGGGEKGKPQKKNLRVDFTPMVDMNMLLITFFMFCTSLSKPQTMDLVLPTKDNQELTEDEKNKVKDSKAITVILGENNNVYYYFGKPNYEDYTSLKVTDYSSEGLRAMLLERNAPAVAKMTELKRKRLRKEISEEEFKKQSSEIRNDPNGEVVVIKPTDSSTYKNLVDALDEMQICSIGKYALVDIAEGDEFLVENYQKKGALSAQAAGK